MRLDAVLALAKAEPSIADSGEGWDADPWLLGVANGVVDLRTGAVREGRPEDRITMHSPIPYDPEAQCPRCPP
jgi:putative DNA primase/helicase